MLRVNSANGTGGSWQATLASGSCEALNPNVVSGLGSPVPERNRQYKLG